MQAGPVPPPPSPETPSSYSLEFATLHAKKDFAGMMRLRTLRWGIALDYPGGPAWSQSPYRGRRETRGGDHRSTGWSAGFAGQDRPQAEEHGGPWRPERQGMRCPGTWRRRVAGRHLGLGPRPTIALLTTRTVRP